MGHNLHGFYGARNIQFSEYDGSETHVAMATNNLPRTFGFNVRCVEDGAIIAVESISLNRTSINKLPGSREPISFSISPANATNQAVIWSSSNTDIAVVDDFGSLNTAQIIGISVGTATITATTKCGSRTATAIVTIEELPYIPSSLEGVVIDGIRWATRNVDTPGTFANAPSEAGMFYQFNGAILIQWSILMVV